MRWTYIILRFLKIAENFLLMCWICAETLQEMRWNFSTAVVNLCWNFSTDVVNLCWNFASNALKFYCFHVFSKVLKFFFGCAEFALKLCKKCAELILFYVFSRSLKIFYWCVEFVLKLCKKCAEIFLRLWWICAETLQEMRWNFIVFTFSQKCWNFSLDVLNLRWNFVKNALNLYYFTFSQDRWKFSTDVLNLCWNFARNALKFFYGCGEFLLKLCKKCAEILLFSRFLKSAETFLWMWWICAETL